MRPPPTFTRATVLAVRAGLVGQQTRSQRLSLGSLMLHSAAEAVFHVSLLVWAFDSGGPSRAGYVWVVNLAFAAISTPMATRTIDRLGALKAYRLACASQTLALFALYAVLATDSGPVVVVAVASISSGALVLTRPAHYSLLPDLLEDPRRLISLTRDSRVAELVGIVGGPLIATLAFAVSGSSLAMAIAGVFTGLAGVLLLALTAHERTTDHEIVPVTTADDRTLVTRLRHEPGALGVIALGLLHYIVIGARGVLFVALASQKSGSSAASGIVTACYSFGALLATLISRRRLPPTVFPWMLTGAVAFVGAMVLTASTPNVVFMACAALAGAALATVESGNRTMLPRSLPSQLLGRVYGLQETMQMIGLAIGGISAPFIVETFGLTAAVIFFGSLPLAVVVGLRTRLLALDRRGIERTEAMGLVAGADLFDGASPSVLAALAFAMHRDVLDEGTVLIRQNDHGETMFLIESGAADVIIDGEYVRTLVAGNYFGELALLRQKPRSASIVAREKIATWELGSGPFLMAVTRASNEPEQPDQPARRHPR